MSFLYLIDDLNIVLREASRVAMPNENLFCDAIVFTHRPVLLFEKVYFWIARLSSLWNGLVRFGFFSFEYCGGDFVDIVKVYRGSIFKSLMRLVILKNLFSQSNKKINKLITVIKYFIRNLIGNQNH